MKLLFQVVGTGRTAIHLPAIVHCWYDLRRSLCEYFVFFDSCKFLLIFLPPGVFKTIIFLTGGNASIQSNHLLFLPFVYLLCFISTASSCLFVLFWCCHYASYCFRMHAAIIDTNTNSYSWSSKSLLLYYNIEISHQLLLFIKAL